MVTAVGVWIWRDFEWNPRVAIDGRPNLDFMRSDRVSPESVWLRTWHSDFHSIHFPCVRFPQ